MSEAEGPAEGPSEKAFQAIAACAAAHFTEDGACAECLDAFAADAVAQAVKELDEVYQRLSRKQALVDGLRGDLDAYRLENAKQAEEIERLAPMVNGLHKKLEDSREEIERLRAWVDDLQSGMYVNCVYCGHQYGPGETTPVSMADALKAHVERCPKHPMSALKKELAEARAEERERAKQIVSDRYYGGQGLGAVLAEIDGAASQPGGEPA